MAEVNKISSFKSFSEVKSQESEMKLREENNLKKQETLVKIEEILDEMGLSSLSEIDEDSQQLFISKLLSGERTNEGNAFVYAAGKAKAEGKTEFEFNGKKYKVTIKDTGIKEGNAFGDAVRKAKDAGEKEFDFEGETYKVEENIDEAISRSVYDRMDGLHNIKSMQSLIDSAKVIFDDLSEEMFDFDEICDFIVMKIKKSKLAGMYESVANEATVDVDATDPKDKGLAKLLKKHNVSLEVINKNGPSGWPEVKLTGDVKDLKAVLADDEYGWDDEDLAEYIEEAAITEGKHGMAKKLLKGIIDGDSSEAEGIKLSKDLADHYLSWINTSPFGKKNENLPIDMLIKASFNWGIERQLDPKLKNELDALKTKINESIITEAKDDFMAKHSGTDIWLKKGYKNHTEDELQALYFKIGEVVKDNLDVKQVTVLFEANVTEGGYRKEGPSTAATHKAEQLKKLKALRVHTEETDRLKKAQLKRAKVAGSAKESVVNEAEIKSDDEFKDYAFTILKKAFGADFDEKKGQDIVDGILKKSDGDYGAAVGMITSSLGESVTNEAFDAKYWEDYHEKSTKITSASKVARAVEDAVEDWNDNNEDGEDNEVTNGGEKKVMNLAHDFFKAKGWISSDVIEAMIAQES